MCACSVADHEAHYADTPFIILNAMTTALMAYGLVGLRNDPSAIFIYMALIGLQALVSNQFLVTCVWLTPTAVRLTRPSIIQMPCRPVLPDSHAHDERQYAPAADLLPPGAARTECMPSFGLLLWLAACTHFPSHVM